MHTVIDLNGSWDFVADLDPRYHTVHGGYEKPDANRRHWLRVPVPGVWQSYGERYAIYEGVCWYARELELPGLPDRATARLCFEGVSYQAEVYVNGEPVGSHEGGYTPFALDVSKVLKPGRNVIAVRVDNRATTIKWPPVLGYFNYGGIHRDVKLEITDGPWLVEVTLEAAESTLGWELAVGGRVEKAENNLLVRVSSEAGAYWEDWVAPDGALDVHVPFCTTPSWSPEAPELVPVTVELLDQDHNVLDRIDTCFGFRTLAMREGQILLNGEPYPVRGVCYVYDSPITGLVMTTEQVEADLRLIKGAGCNAVRCHTPMDRRFYEACDRLGLLVWIEPPIYCYHPGDNEAGTRFADPEWLALAQQMAREMIAEARNHPSVAIYSIGNECNTANPEAEAFFRALAATVREADGTRLVSYAALYGIIGPIADLVDVLGINSYYGWYDQIRQDGTDLLEGEANLPTGDGIQRRAIDLTTLREMLGQVLERKPGLALFLTEFGADSQPGYHSRSHELWSEDYHAALLQEILAAAKDTPQIVGTFPFCFSDYRDPSKVVNGYWNGLNLKGLVDYMRRPKLAYQAVREAYLAQHGPSGTP